jgi:hypothetical protein
LQRVATVRFCDHSLLLWTSTATLHFQPKCGCYIVSLTNFAELNIESMRASPRGFPRSADQPINAPETLRPVRGSDDIPSAADVDRLRNSATGQRPAERSSISESIH